MTKKPYTVSVEEQDKAMCVTLNIGVQSFPLAYDSGDDVSSRSRAGWMAEMLTKGMDVVYEAGKAAGRSERGKENNHTTTTAEAQTKASSASQVW